jgi:beta-glucosidase
MDAVLLFVRDEYRITSPEVKLLKHFRKVALQPGQTALVTFELTAADLAFVDVDMRWVVRTPVNTNSFIKSSIH